MYKLTQVDILNWDERTIFNITGNTIGNGGGYVNQLTVSDEKLIHQMQEEIAFLKAENQRLWGLVEKLQ